MDRRSFLKTIGLGVGGTVGAAVSSRVARAESAAEGADGDKEPFVSILVDTTKCVGCRMCEKACAEANGLEAIEQGPVFTRVRETDEKHWTVVNRFDTSKGPVTVKRQCMHCAQPACASACLTQAMKKTVEGPIIWREDRCMGCRFCMVSCPFDMPKFEYHSAVPKIQKCQMCYERVEQGQQPACVEACPMEALQFGTRPEMLAEAHKRIAEDPDTYVDHIYGETEVGGTGYLYLSKVPFREIGFREDLGTTPYPEYTKGFLYSVPVVLAIWPAFLAGVSKATEPGDDPDDTNPHGGE